MFCLSELCCLHGKKINALYFSVNVFSTNVLTVACVANSLNPWSRVLYLGLEWQVWLQRRLTNWGHYYFHRSFTQKRTLKNMLPWVYWPVCSWHPSQHAASSEVQQPEPSYAHHRCDPPDMKTKVQLRWLGLSAGSSHLVTSPPASLAPLI